MTPFYTCYNLLLLLLFRIEKNIYELILENEISKILL